MIKNDIISLYRKYQNHSFSLSECEKKIVNERINLNNHIAFLYPEFNENIKTKLLEEKQYLLEKLEAIKIAQVQQKSADRIEILKKQYVGSQDLEEINLKKQSLERDFLLSRQVDESKLYKDLDQNHIISQIQNYQKDQQQKQQESGLKEIERIKDLDNNQHQQSILLLQQQYLQQQQLSQQQNSIAYNIQNQKHLLQQDASDELQERRKLKMQIQKLVQDQEYEQVKLNDPDLEYFDSKFK